ncbi:MAG: hypothetical protein FH749_04000 [Firmicutes bacterium]|nr:hypothetical protein [Bacillota bacterium]
MFDRGFRLAIILVMWGFAGAFFSLVPEAFTSSILLQGLWLAVVGPYVLIHNLAELAIPLHELSPVLIGLAMTVMAGTGFLIGKLWDIKLKEQD